MLCLYSREVILAFWCPLYFIMMYLLNHSSAASLERCAISLSLFTLSRSSAFSCSWPECSLVHSRDRREEPDRRPCADCAADSRRPEGQDRRRHPRWLRVPNPQSRRQSVLGAHDGRRGRRRWILSVRVLVWLSGSNRLALRLDAEEASRWWWIGFDDGFYILSRIGSICWGLGSISYHALEVSAEAWHSILHLITPWQYSPRLGIRFYILLCVGSICRGLAFNSISYHAVAVSTEAWHSILYLITHCPWLLKCHLESRSDLSLPVRQACPGLSGLAAVNRRWPSHSPLPAVHQLSRPASLAAGRVTRVTESVTESVTRASESLTQCLSTAAAPKPKSASLLGSGRPWSPYSEHLHRHFVYISK